MIRNYQFIVNILSFTLAIFAIVIAAIGVFDVIIVSGLTSLLGLLICLLRLEDKERTKAIHHIRFIIHSAMALALPYLFYRWGRIMFEQEEFFITISDAQNMLAWVAIVIIGYVTLRLFGKPMALVLVLAIGYLLLPEGLGQVRIGFVQLKIFGFLRTVYLAVRLKPFQELFLSLLFLGQFCKGPERDKCC